MSAPVKPWTGRAVTEARAWMRAYARARDLPCCICKEPIDYSLEYPDALSMSIQHVKPRAFFPHLTWARSNWAPCHLECNTREGVGTYSKDLGVMSEDW